MRCGFACELSVRTAERGDIAVDLAWRSTARSLRRTTSVSMSWSSSRGGVTPDVIERIFEGPRAGGPWWSRGRATVVPRDVPRAGCERPRRADPRPHRPAPARSPHLHPERAPRDGHGLSRDADDTETIRDISNEYAEYLAELAPHAVEVMKSGDRAHYARFQTADGAWHSVACVARSDHHSVEAFANRDAVTYVKVSRRDLAACVTRSPSTRPACASRTTCRPHLHLGSWGCGCTLPVRLCSKTRRSPSTRT